MSKFSDPIFKVNYDLFYNVRIPLSLSFYAHLTIMVDTSKQCKISALHTVKYPLYESDPIW